MSNFWKVFGKGGKSADFIPSLVPLKDKQQELDEKLREERCQLTHVDKDDLICVLGQPSMVQAFKDIAAKHKFDDASDAFCEVIGLTCTDDNMRQAIIDHGARAVVIEECKFDITDNDAKTLEDA